jgi:hypothetical protein
VKSAGFLLAVYLLLLQDVAPVAITGIVEDENRLPVSGVQVTLRFGNQTRRASTNELGRFRFADVPVGTHQLDFDKPDFFRLRDYAVVAVAASTDVTVTLVREYEIRSQVDVVASPQEIDQQETKHEDELVAREIRETPVPGSHSLENALPAIPGVVKDTRGIVHVAGARDEDTMVVLDGFQMNDPATGGFSGRINIDAVRTVGVVSGRYGAQYANAGAGVLGLQTDNGDDHWRFGTTNFLPSFEFDRGLHLGNWFPRVTFSGPLKKGRAWFSNSTSLQHGFSLIRELPPGEDISYYWAGDNLLRAQYNFTPSHSLQGNFLYNGALVSRAGLGPFSPLPTTTDSRSQRYFVSLKDQISFIDGLLEFGVASDNDHFKLTPQGSQPYVLTPEGPRGNYFERLASDSRRWQGRTDLTLTGRRWKGTHTFQVGFSFDQTGLNQLASRSPIELRAADSSLVRQASFTGNPNLSVSQWQGGAYAQDSWQLTRSVLLQVGARLDKNDLTRQVLPQPRVVVNWGPREGTKFSGGWGTYYQPVYPSLISPARDQQRLDTLDPNAAPLVTSFSIGNSLRQPFFETWSAEWQQQWNRRTTSSVHMMDRRQRRGLVYENLSSDPNRQDFQLINNRSDRYRAVDVSLRYSLQADSDLMIDYTWSRARSNSLFDYAVKELLLAGRAAGPLSWDAPHRVISRGAVQTDLWSLLFSYFAEYRTGFPFSSVDSQYRLAGVPNGMRYPDYFSVNAAAEKRFRFRGHEWAFRLSAINLTGHRNYNSVINNVDSPEYRTFAGGQGRAFTARIRLVGRK